MKTLRFIVQIVLAIGLTFLVQALDRRRLTDEQRARAWNAASWGSALYAFGPYSMLGWFVVTRRGVLRFVLGPLATVALIGVIWAADQLVAMALGLPP